MLRKLGYKQTYFVLVLLLFVIGLFLRAYNFQNRLIFGPEQAISLITGAENLDKFSLLGEINVQRSTSTGLNPFHGAYFNYFLIPFILLFNFQPLPITYVFLFLNLLTAFIFFRVTRKIFGETIAIFSLTYFIFSDKMIHHSLFIWNLNFLPLLGVLALWFLYKLKEKPSDFSSPFWVGIINGVGFGLQYLFFPFIVLISGITIFLSKKKIDALALLIAGSVIGSLSMVIFDLRHDFYYVRTLWQILLDVLSHRVGGNVSYYDFMYILPFLFLFFSWITELLYKYYKPLCFFPIIIFIVINLKSPLINFQQSTGVIPGINLKAYESFSAEINKDNPPEKFNVATLWDFDTRAYPLRYFLTYLYRKTPQGLEDYHDLDALYVAAPDSYDINHPSVFELNAYEPYQVIVLSSEVPGFKLYKLTK